MKLLSLNQGLCCTVSIDCPDTIEVKDDTGCYIAYRQSIAFICPVCLTCWAKLELGSRFRIAPVCCELCDAPANRTYQVPVPGSVLYNVFTWSLGWHIVADPQLIYSLPDDLVRREFNLTMRAFT